MSNENFEMENQVEVNEEKTEISNEHPEVVENFELMDGLLPVPQEPKPKKKWVIGAIGVFMAMVIVAVGIVRVHNIVEQKKFEALADIAYSDILKQCEESQDYFAALEEIKKFKSEHQEYENIITQKFNALYLEIDKGLQELSENDYLKFEEISKPYLDNHEKSGYDEYVRKIKELQKRVFLNILSSNGLNFNDIEVIKEEPLVDIEGEEGDAIWRYVFGKTIDGNSGMYFTAALDLKNKKMATIEISQPFLFSIWKRLLIRGSQSENERLYNDMKECIQKGGFNYFTDYKNSLEFMRAFTSQNSGIYRTWVEDALPEIYGNDVVNKWKSNEEFRVLFERGTAVPKVIVVKTTVNEYQWKGIYPEGYLGLLDYETRVVLKAEYGPPYELEEKWVASVINSETGNTSDGITFDSLDAIKTQYKVE